MPKTTYESVTVTMKDGKLACTPDWVHLYWETGPADIRWAFKGVPKKAVGAVVEFHAEVPAKYGTTPPKPGEFRARGVHRGVGHAPASAGSHLPDIVTTGNTQEAGYFYYDIRLLDASGAIIAQADPGGDNDPTPPN
ncbi:MAG TPA: hypothetical protein VMT45_06415 [Thermoanaerobaculaceae bacterium]|nr:hypothetical protein [Thermoanaerobaculaceae bacterium]